jgi:hypothetical protein
MSHRIARGPRRIGESTDATLANRRAATGVAGRVFRHQTCYDLAFEGYPKRMPAPTGIWTPGTVVRLTDPPRPASPR